MQRSDYLAPTIDPTAGGRAGPASYPRRRFSAPPRADADVRPASDERSGRPPLMARIAACLVQARRDRPPGADGFPLLWG